MRCEPSSLPADALAAIKPAFDRYGMHDPWEWIQRCRDDLAQLWRVDDVWAVTEVFDCQAGRVCHIVAMAGDFTQEIMQRIEFWALEMGCRKMLFTGRRGWARRLPDYSQTAIVMEKVLR